MSSTFEISTIDEVIKDLSAEGKHSHVKAIERLKACNEYHHEEMQKYRFMIDNGLGWEDMRTDGALGEGADR